jgi:redox-sensing transcriptional repressor
MVTSADAVTVGLGVNGENLPANVPAASVARLPLYWRALRGLLTDGINTTSSRGLAELSGVSSVQLRKDLSYLGSFGRRGVGYNVRSLSDYLTQALGLVGEHRLAIVGMGNLGLALANYSGYASRGFEIAALFDAAATVVGMHVRGLVVEHVDNLEAAIAREQVTMALLATPAQSAQAITDRLVGAGVREILNFAPIALHVPDVVVVRSVDVGTELQILAFHAQARAAGGGRLPAGPG